MNNKRIRTYEDLEEERHRLMGILRTQEDVIKEDLTGVREGLKPYGKALNVMSKMATRDNTAPMMNLGLEMGIDLLLRRVLLARAGWIARTIVPFIVKNYSSHLVGEEKREELMKKIKNIFRKVRPKEEVSADVQSEHQAPPGESQKT